MKSLGYIDQTLYANEETRSAWPSADVLEMLRELRQLIVDDVEPQLDLEQPGEGAWEYAVAERDGRVRGRFDGPKDRETVEDWFADQREMQRRGCYLIRRRVAGPWERAAT